MPSELTPMMKQYLKMKQLHPDCILFFRLGDFYEMFQDDAKLASKELDLTLTTRDRGKPEDQRTPMCGVPYHSADAYIARLIAKGYKVAICEQMEDPATAKGLVDRDIIRIVTPGTVIASSMLEEGRNNFICAIYQDSAGAGLCFCDISTGEISVTSFTGPDAAEHLCNELGRFSPREAMLSDGAYSDAELLDFLTNKLDCRCENGGEARFRPDSARSLVEGQFTSGLDQLPQGDDHALQAVGGLLSYLYETQKTDLSHITSLTWYTSGQFMELDLTARRNLELTETLRSKEKKGSLLWVLDKTRTAMGHRLIRTWMERPLLSPGAISRRLGAVEELVGDPIGRDELVRTLREVTDLERLIGRIVYGTAGGRDLMALAAGLGKLPRLRELLSPYSGALLTALSAALDDLPDLRDLICSAIVDEPPFSVREGGFIREGYNLADLDGEVRADAWAKEAVRMALVNLSAVAAPAGTMPVVLGAGWPGVLLHEAVGHGLEGDFNRRGTSVFSGQVGELVASELCTVVDDGTMVDRRGSVAIDDEGTPGQYNVLIENGILKGYMQDKLNARLMGMTPTGNGRRESYAHLPMPRMTNTYMLPGKSTPQEIIESVEYGIYAPNFGGGQVDITSGKFVFSTSEAYLIENGKVTKPVKGATLIGSGIETMQQISMVGNDLKLDNGVGVCGKEGQSLPVGVGQPTLKVDNLTVGGTA